MRNVLIMNFLYRPKPYPDSLVARAQYWIDFFLRQDMHVIGTVPSGRKEAIDRLAARDEERCALSSIMSFDTCDRWRRGLSDALEKFPKADHFFLWSADFVSPEEESKESGKPIEETGSMRAALELINYRGQEDLVVGTIEASGTKEAIDRFGTYPLLQLWFPEEFQSIVHMGLLKPRSELLRLSPDFLESALGKRWYPTEQTIHLILQCLWSSEQNQPYGVTALQLPKIPDEPSARSNLDAVQQVDRMELWLKYIWRDKSRGWVLLDYLSRCQKSFEIVQRAYNALEIVILNEASLQPGTG